MACLGAERSGKGGCGGLPRQASNSHNPFIILVLSSLPETRYTIVQIKIGLGGVSYTVSIRSFVVSSFFSSSSSQVARADKIICIFGGYSVNMNEFPLEWIVLSAWGRP